MAVGADFGRAFNRRKLSAWLFDNMRFDTLMSIIQYVVKSVAILVGTCVLVLWGLMGAVFLEEGLNPLDEYADTEFAPNYTPAKFEQIKVGMKMPAVRKIIGNPLSTFRDTLPSSEVILQCHFTNDGYLGRRRDKPYSLVADLAWYRSSVAVGADSIVVSKDWGWSYD